MILIGVSLTKQCQQNMMIYGRTLLQHVPEETTALLIDLCSGTLGKDPVQSTSDIAKSGSGGTSGPAVLSYLGYNRVAGMFTSEPTATSPVDSTQDSAIPTANGHRVGSKATQASAKSTVTAQPFSSTEPSYLPPSPRMYFAHFVDHHDLFIHFLEAVALTLWNQKVDISSGRASGPSSPSPPYDMDEKDNVLEDETKADQRAVWNTLLELYLSSTRSAVSEVSKLAREKALGLLASSLPLDTMHALLLCSTAGFTEGTVRLWERLGMYEEVLRFYMAPVQTGGENTSGDKPNGSGTSQGDKVFRALDLYGPEHPYLYPLVLRWLTGSPEVLQQHGKELPRVLQEIDERRIMPPLMVVQLLSRNGVASVGHVKDWLKGKVAENKQDIASVSDS